MNPAKLVLFAALLAVTFVFVAELGSWLCR
jgi:hypothetical protein